MSDERIIVSRRDTRPWFRSTDGQELRLNGNSVELTSSLRTTQSIVFTKNLFSIKNETLASVLGLIPSLVVTTETVDKLYGQKMRNYLSQRTTGVGHEILVLSCRESTKTFDEVTKVCNRASIMNLGRRARIVAVGGGVCTDICGFAAAIYRRGISHIKIPTTLVGLIDAGIATKNAVNLNGFKNRIGTFYPPEYSILDPLFLRTLDSREIRSGMAESIKMATICDRELFEILERSGEELIESHFEKPDKSSWLVVRTSVLRMLEYLNQNAYEVNDYRRAVDFGHTFSPIIESTSNGALTHGEAVAIDIAISVHLAKDLGLLNTKIARRIFRLLHVLGVVPDSFQVDPNLVWRSLLDVTAHRNGRLSLVVPTGIGRHTFVDDIESIGIIGLAAILKKVAKCRESD